MSWNYSIRDFPDEIILIIQGYLSSADFLRFLSTSKARFQQLKYNHGYWSLTLHSITLFLDDSFFQERLLRKVKNSCQQIAVRMRPILPFHQFSGESLKVHKVIIVCQFANESLSIPYLPHISCFQLEGTASDISNCSHLKSFVGSLGDSISDISPLVNLSDVQINFWSNINLTIAGLVKCYPGETLSNITSLSLYGCPNIEDVKPLRGIRHLEIYWCKKVKDISGLGNHYSLTICDCAAVLSGYDILRTVPIVTLGGYDISDLSVLQNAKEVNISHCHNIEDVSYLRKVRKVALLWCSRITDISSLDGVRDLTIDNLPSLTTSILKMKDNCTFKASIYKPAHNWDLLTAVHVLSVKNHIDTNSFPFSSVRSSFPYLRDLTILHIMTDFSLQDCGHIETIKISECSKLTSLQGLGNNRSVTIERSPLITDVSCLRKVPIVTIRSCKGIKDYSCLEGAVVIE